MLQQPTRTRNKKLGSLTLGTMTGEVNPSRSQKETFARNIRLELESATSRRRCQGRHRRSSLTCDIRLACDTPCVGDTTLEQNRYYIKHILKPCLENMLISETDANAIIDREKHLLRTSCEETRPVLQPVSIDSTVNFQSS